MTHAPPTPARVILRGLLWLATLSAVVYGVHALQLDQGWIDRAVRGQGPDGVLIFVLAGGLATAIGVPRQVVAFLGGYAFDWAAGTAWALLASVLGCAAALLYARWLGRGLIVRRLPGLVARLDAVLTPQPFAMALLIRLLPVGHNLSTNLVAGVSSVRVWPFITGSALGYLPQTLVFALAGSGISLDPTVRLTLAVLLFLASAALGLWLYRRYRAQVDP
ncbi:MAG: VTT domain-containing protein [Thiobacillaceae bacterium]|nr:VTT domain-containing protein [Thiobacillaceae bacterium]MCX7672313.1 VTT domain-containing protein [Thiobacillaceae bacterium]MDW8323252.1 VTT domain-containing protein [Burkholderiales bacterium]